METLHQISESLPCSSTATTNTSLLCHGCMEPYPTSLRVSCPRCNVCHYCSKDCQQNESLIEGGHSIFHCQIIHKLYKSKLCGGIARVQICSDDETFPEYEIESQGPCAKSIAQTVPENRGIEETFVCQVKSTGKHIECKIGDQASILLFPNEFDSAGSFLIEMESKSEILTNSSTPIVVLCDVFALEIASPILAARHNSSSMVKRMSDSLWSHGISLWKDRRDYLGAMNVFQESLDCYQWNCFSFENRHEVTDIKTLTEIDVLDAMVQPSTIQEEHSRSQLSKRLYFLGMCLNDNDQKLLAVKYLMLALQTKMRQDSMKYVFTELMLTFEETRNMVASRAVAKWSICQGESQWQNIYQRPGFVCSGLHQWNCEIRYLHLLKPHFAPSDEGYPKWCHTLKNHYSVIRDEFLNLLNKTCESSITASATSHWPQVGERVEHDQRIVSGGNWREVVLFGPGVTTFPNSESIAPKTKHLIHTYAPEVVSLCNQGGGEVIFSMLAPHTYISPHCASSNIRLTAHLGLMVPKKSEKLKNNKAPSQSRPACGIRVGNKWHQWNEGDFLVFDDSYEHEVVNDTNECRCVLLLRFWHPGIPKSSWRVAINEIIEQKKMSDEIRFIPPS